MSALQINARPSDASPESHGFGYDDLRAAMIADRDVAVMVRTALGILITAALSLVIAGFASQSAVAIIIAGIGVVVMSALLAVLPRVPAKSK